MPTEWTQSGRITDVSSPLGKDVLLLDRMTVREQLSKPFHIEAWFYSEKQDIAFDSIIGKKMGFRTTQQEGKERYFNGFVSRFSQGRSEVVGPDARRPLVQYRAEVVPWLWFLGLRTDCRIYQNKRVTDILKDVFAKAPSPNFDIPMKTPKRDYCVQFRETDLNFVSRLMEEEGLYFYFEHSADQHVLKCCDAAAKHPDTPHQSTFDYAHALETSESRWEVDDLEVEQEVCSGKYALRDYNPLTPNTDLLVQTQGKEKIGGNEKYEVFDYPGEYAETGEGDRRVRLRMEAEEAASHSVQGSSNCPTFSAGYKMKVAHHYRSGYNQPYLLTEVMHTITEGLGTGDSLPSYENSFRCIPHSVQFRPLQETPKPVVQGVQSAEVCGPSGEEIYTDEHGRVKVQFYWDRHGKNDDESSCWIRISSGWAGKGWGMFSLPRIGQEVLVDFVDGDPDRPIITGRVYNGEQVPPYDLPAEKTKSTWQSRSSKEGTTNTYNEIRFEDKKGDEEVYLQAQKDYRERIKNKSSTSVGASKSVTVGANMNERVGKERHLVVEADRLASIKASDHLHVAASRKLKVDKDAHLDVMGEGRTRYGSDFSLDIGGARKEKVGMDSSLDAGMNIHQKAGINLAADAGSEIHLKAGMSVVIEAGMQLSLKVGGNFIALGPAGIFINGIMVNINSGGAAGSGSGASPVGPDAPEAPDEAFETQEPDDKA